MSRNALAAICTILGPYCQESLAGVLLTNLPWHDLRSTAKHIGILVKQLMVPNAGTSALLVRRRRFRSTQSPCTARSLAPLCRYSMSDALFWAIGHQLFLPLHAPVTRHFAQRQRC